MKGTTAYIVSAALPAPTSGPSMAIIALPTQDFKRSSDGCLARPRTQIFGPPRSYTFLKLTVFALPGILPVSVLLVRVELL